MIQLYARPLRHCTASRTTTNHRFFGLSPPTSCDTVANIRRICLLYSRVARHQAKENMHVFVNRAAQLDGISIHQGVAITIALRSCGSVEASGGARSAIATCQGGHGTSPYRLRNRATCMVAVVEGVATDSSGACSARLVASRNLGEHTCTSVYSGCCVLSERCMAKPSTRTVFKTARETWHKML